VGIGVCATSPEWVVGSALMREPPQGVTALGQPLDQGERVARVPQPDPVLD